jgi:hypothetical protein
MYVNRLSIDRSDLALLMFHTLTLMTVEFIIMQGASVQGSLIDHQ